MRFARDGAQPHSLTAKERLALTALAPLVIGGVIQRAPDFSQPDVLKLWPDQKMPGKAAFTPERELPPQGDNVLRIVDVNVPTLTIFKPRGDREKPTPALVICPGGAYARLSFDKEGTEIAEWFNGIGITAAVLKYRVPDNREGAYQDAHRAIRVLRREAVRWNVKPDAIGVLGFSAGGHLGARLSAGGNVRPYSRLDSIDDESGQPNFAILVYPAYLNQGDQLAPDISVNASLPPTLLIHAEDDRDFFPSSLAYSTHLARAGGNVSFRRFAEGGHGFGLRSEADAREWPASVVDWLTQQKISAD